MERIKYVLNIISDINKEINELFYILENLNIDDDEKHTLIQLFTDFDQAFGYFEMKLEEIKEKMDKNMTVEEFERQWEKAINNNSGKHYNTIVLIGGNEINTDKYLFVGIDSSGISIGNTDDIILYYKGDRIGIIRLKDVKLIY